MVKLFLLCVLQSNMPPSKGAPARGMRACQYTKGTLPKDSPSSLTQKNIEFKTVKSAGSSRRRGRQPKETSILSGNKQQDEALLKLRIPLHICRVLPSIKKFTAKTKANRLRNQRHSMIFQTENQESSGQSNSTNMQQAVFGVRKRKNDLERYTIQFLREQKFQGMIWDIGFTDTGDVIVTGSEGAMLCDQELNIKRRFDNIILPGAVAFLSDGRTLIVDRSSDTVNVYRKNGAFLRSFHAGKCPMGVDVNSKDEIIVSDTGDKCVRKFDILGHLLLTIPTNGDCYTMKWPLYLALLSNDDIIVSDVHLQKVLHFSTEGVLKKTFPLKTQGGSYVLRPHGVCTTVDDEVVVVDTSIDSMELFLPSGMYMQTLLSPDDGSLIEPKLTKLSKDRLLAVGGMKGIVRLYKLADVAKEDPVANKNRQGQDSAAHYQQVAKEVKHELDKK